MEVEVAGKFVGLVEKGLVEEGMVVEVREEVGSLMVEVTEEEGIVVEVREEEGSLMVAWGLQVMMVFPARCIHLKDEEVNWFQPPRH